MAAAVLAFALGACGDSSDSNPSGESTASNGDVFNDADVEFATNMIPHHAQAIEMVTLIDTRQVSSKVKQLAEDIRAAQSPEVQRMVDWLRAWGKKVPETTLDHTNAGHDMSSMDDMDTDMPGMMSAEDMQALGDAQGAEFEDMWLQMMMEHHQGAIEMAQTEIDDGTNPDAILMAKSIVSSQQAEIDEIQQLLGG